MKAQVWKNEALGAEWEYKEIPEDLKEISQKYRTELVELAVEQDEKLMESYLNGDEIKEEDLVRCIRKGTIIYEIHKWFIYRDFWFSGCSIRGMVFCFGNNLSNLFCSIRVI